MKQWLISIAVTSAISAIADMLLPRSIVSRYAKLCISLMLTVVIVKPLIGLYNKDFTFELPETEYSEFSTENTDALVDNEFSSRLTTLLREDTGIEDISVTAKLGYDRIISVAITGVQEGQHSQVNSVLKEKYNIPAEIVNYGAD